MEYQDKVEGRDPYTLRDEVPVEINAIPTRGLAVQAATLSFLQPDNDSALKDYQDTMGRAPSEIPSVLQQKIKASHAQMREVYSHALIPLLADPTVPFEQKQAAFDSQRQETEAPDPLDTFATEALVLASPGETVQGENVRMSILESMNQVNDHYRQIQEIENSVKSDQSNHSGKVLDLLEMFLPGEMGLTAGKIAQGLYGDTSITAAAALLPGSARKQLSEAIANMPMEARVDFIQQLAPIVSESSGILTDKNQLRINQWLSEVARGDVDAMDQWVDNIFNVLDLTGIGKLLTAGPKAARKVAESGRKLATAQRTSAEERFAQYTNRVDPSENRPHTEPITGVTGDAQITSVPQVRSNIDALELAESQRADLLGKTSGQLDKGQVRSLNEELKALKSDLKNGGLTPAQLRMPGAATAAVERRQNIQAQITRVEDQINRNADAAKVDQEIAKLDSTIEQLKKDISTRPQQLNPIAAAIHRTELNSVIGFSNPRTPASILDNTNPSRARNLHAQIYMQSEGFVNAVTGGTKNEALIRAVLPQVGDSTGVVKRVLDDKESTLRAQLSKELGLAVKNTFGGFAFTERELAAARAAKVEDYSTVSGLKINDAMTSFKTSDDGLHMEVDAVYTNGEGGWLRAEDAVSQATVALRKQGVVTSDLEILRRNGGEYEPVKLDEVKGKDGEYAVRLRIRDSIRPEDITDWDALDVKRNLFDYFETKGENTWGSINRHVIDAASSVHKQITGSLTLADDKAARLSSAFTEMFEVAFSVPYQRLPAARRQAIDEYIKEANVKELKFDRQALRSRFTDPELDVIQGWRDAWDVMWDFENYDLVKSLIRDNFKLIDHPNLRAVVRERPKRYDNRVVYNPNTDAVEKLTDAQIDDLYKTGGNIAEFRRPLDIAGKEVTHIRIENNAASYARAFKENDKMLDKRDGYYQVFYKHPQFIEETLPGKTPRVIQVVGNIRDAKKLAEDLKKQFPDREYTRRGDDRGIDRSKDAYWDMQHVGGRLAQRHRGELLENSVGLKSMGEMDFIHSPADSAVRAAQSIGGRLAMRDTLEVAKQRFLDQYKSVLPMEDGRPVFPANRGQIRQKGTPTNTKLADARTVWEYIRSVENGYINAMDGAVKNAFNLLAEYSGAKGYDTVEKLARAGEDVNVTGTIKGGVFASMMASNPLRQIIVQPNQSLRMAAYNPSGFFSGRVMGMLAEEFKVRITGQTASPKDSFGLWLNETGVEQAITRGNLIRGTLLDAAEGSTLLSKTHDATLGNLRKIGYDTGEKLNLAIHGAFVFDKYKQAGRDILNRRVREEMHAELRHLTGNMNLAGDMPYNQNALALLFTYMQVPHKFLLMSANRGLTPAMRMRLLAADLTIWGLPVATITAAAGVDLPVENEWMREFLEDGLQSVALNQMATIFTGEKQRVDWSSLEPFGLESWYKMGDSFLFDGAVKGMVSNTPTARVFGLGADSRLGLAIKTTTSYFKDVFEVDDMYTATDLLDVANSWASMSSGWTNFQKARAAWMFSKMRDRLDRPTDDDVTKWEAIAQAFGFGTKDTSDFYATMKLANKKDIEETAKKDMEEIARMISLATNNDPMSEKSIRMYSQLMSSTGWLPDKEAHRKYLHRIEEGWKVDANEKVRKKLFDEVINLPRPDVPSDPIKNSSLTEEDKQLFLQTRQMQMEQLSRFQKMAEEDLKKD